MRVRVLGWPWRDVRQEGLGIDHCGLLQCLEPVLFVGSMLVHDEDVTAQAGDDESQVKLAYHLSRNTWHTRTTMIRHM